MATRSDAPGDRRDRDEAIAGTDRPLTARSVLASTLLGTHPPRMPVRELVRAGTLFGLEEGAVRTALSRMVTAGEAVRTADGSYELVGKLVERQRRQDAGRAATTLEWSGGWRQAVVVSGGRSAADRAALRRSMQRLRMGELRDSVWIRPDNLPADRLPEDRAVVEPFTRWFTVHPADDSDLVDTLWDLPAWQARAMELRRSMAVLERRLVAGDTDALAPGWLLSAAVLRHFNADPMLPRELLGRKWPGDALRADYDRYDATYKSLLGEWLGLGRDGEADRPRGGKAGANGR